MVNKLKLINFGLIIVFLSIISLSVYGGSDNSGANLNLINTVPTITPLHSINYTTPQTNDSILCSVGTFYDANGDTKGGQEWRWLDGTSIVSGQTSQTLPLSAPNLDKGDIITCQSRVNDSYNWSSWLNSSNTATINNTRPNASSVTFNPTPLNSSFNAECQWTYEDDDNDTQNYSNVTWYVNGNVTATTNYSGSWPILSNSNYEKGDNVTCSVLASDNESFYAKVFVNGTIQVVNTRPSNTGISFVTDPSYQSDILTCQVSSRSDVDGDSMTNFYLFYDTDNTTVLQTWSTNNTFDCNSTKNCTKNDKILCMTKVYDSYVNSTTLNSTITIANTNPVAANVTVNNSLPDTVDDLQCQYNYSDVDGDAEAAVYYLWYLNGSTTTNTTQNLSSSFTLDNDEWKCQVIVNDGTVNGTPVNSSAVTIGSDNPTITNFYNTGEIESGDTITYTWTWTDRQLPGGTPYQHYLCNTSNITLSGCADTQFCYVNDNTSSTSCTFTPDGDYGHTQYAYLLIIDGSNNVSIIESNQFLVNHQPTITNITLNVTYASTTNTFTCNASNSSDSDSDSIYTVYAFYAQNGSILQSYSGTNTYITNSGEGTNTNYITCKAKVYDGRVYSAVLNYSTYLRTSELSYSSSRVINTPMLLYVNISNQSTVTFVNFSIKNPYNSIFSQLGASYDSTLDQWKYSFSPNVVGTWYVQDIKVLQDDGQSYFLLGNNDSFSVSAASSPDVPGGGGGGGSKKIEEIPSRGNITGFCGDGYCGEGESPVNCWDDCKVNYDTLFTCIWNEDIECNWSQNWFPIALIGFLLIVVTISTTVYNKRKK